MNIQIFYKECPGVLSQEMQFEDRTEWWGVWRSQAYVTRWQRPCIWNNLVVFEEQQEYQSGFGLCGKYVVCLLNSHYLFFLAERALISFRHNMQTQGMNRPFSKWIMKTLFQTVSDWFRDGHEPSSGQWDTRGNFLGASCWFFSLVRNRHKGENSSVSFPPFLLWTFFVRMWCLEMQ